MGKNKDLIKSVVVLCVIALVAGILLGLFYQITNITDQEKEQRIVLKLNEIKLNDIEPEYERINFTSSDENLNKEIEYFFADRSKGIYAVVATGEPGYKDKVPMYVIIKDDKIIALREGTIKETPGVSDKAFSDNYFEKFLKPIDELNFADVVTGATSTSGAVLSSIKNAVEFYKEYKGSDSFRGNNE